MQITEHPGAELVELRLTGRIDATWAEHLSSTIENAVRGGAHRVILNFAGVDYISSLGIRVLLVQYKLLKSVKGSLVITHPNEFCRNVLTTVGLTEMFCDDDPAAAAAPAASPKQRRGGADYELYPQTVKQAISCAMIGNPERLTTTGFTADDCRTLTFASGSFGVGIGAFGQGYADCEGRFGEFLAAGGCAIALPTSDPHALPDYVVEEGTLVPQVETLYALYGAGDFSTMVRFDAASDGPGKIGLSELVDSLINLAGSDAGTIAFVVLAEAAGIVGATLRKSPAGQPLVQQLPGVREWLSFTTERSSDKTLCLLVGVAGRSSDESSSKFLRPMKTGAAVSAHVHAAVFPYRPVQRGELPFGKTVADLLGASSPNAVLHLMADTRPFEGVGETDLARGACWIGPVSLGSISNPA
jgi:anti-anti-sigma factor